MGYLKGKSTLMIYDRHPEVQSKWNKAFWARGYYVETIGNITEEAVKSILKSRQKNHRRKIQEVPLFSEPVIVLVTPPFWASSKKAIFRANNKPPVELVVADCF